MGEIIFDKSRRNLKKVYNRINSTNLNQYVKAQMEEVLFLAIGGYNRTYELLLAMGLKPDEIATFSNLNLSQQFLNETHKKRAIYLRKINYVTNVGKNFDFQSKRLDLNVADGFEENLMVYENAQRTVGIGKKKEDWQKPSIVVMDDPSLNLQFEGHRFKYETKIGFAQVRNRNATPSDIVQEIKPVDEAKNMMFAMYQENMVDEAEILDGLNRLRESVHLQLKDDWAMNPTEYKKILGSNKLATRLKEIDELGIYQLKTNKRIGYKNARWVIIPDKAFEFKGFDYKDEKDLFNEELEAEENEEQAYIQEQESKLNEILSIELPFNIRQGVIGKQLNSSMASLQGFLEDVDDIEKEKINGLDLLDGATTEEEYHTIKRNNLAYYIDGNFKNNERSDKNYLGGRRLISIDVDDDNSSYEREQVEETVEEQGLFALVYPTAKYYYNGAKRWRIVLMADEEMDKEQYKQTVTGVANMFGLEIDEASKKVSQLMGYPLVKDDVSVISGSMVNVHQFYVEPKPKAKNVLPMNKVTSSNKSVADFEHPQAKLLKQALNEGVPEGKRNETYYQISMYLRDTLDNPDMAVWHDEAAELIETMKEQAEADGLPEKEIEVIFR
ncbi:hypothetical protein [Tetragenococcus koreensis]|uniref:hypothetical protein n=1 Tax=Tetragenococcus koreensis TaxID=290335 RepID=UPI000F4EDFD1|nr:hypothetical protein [Tetragenococcus koreensis]AYW46757.1 hypothetical protein C7K43_13015 [Tetragenococcus koreensis]GEN89976.1 hypothetical protein TKO01_00220 [Tetragenococcus koreensis]